MTHQYCRHCGAKTKMENCAKYLMSNGRYAIYGICAECGYGYHKIIGTKCPKGQKICKCDPNDF